MNTIRQQQRKAVKLHLPILSCVCCHILHLYSVTWQHFPLSLLQCITCHFCVCVYLCVYVLNLSLGSDVRVLIAVDDPCESRVCAQYLCLSVCLHNTCTCVFVCEADASPGGANAQRSNTHTHFERLTNTLYIHLLPESVPTHPQNTLTPPILFNPW